MKKIVLLLLSATALVTPSLAFAREVTIETRLINYSGNAAYLAVYLTKADGSYDQTLWLAGQKQRYFGALRGWVKAIANEAQISVDGITGASVGGGQMLQVKADLADSLIDAGYVIHVDTAVEHGGEYADDATIPLTSTGGSAQGTGYVSTLSLSL
jgi:hypothetical protein